MKTTDGTQATPLAAQTVTGREYRDWRGEDRKKKSESETQSLAVNKQVSIMKYSMSMIPKIVSAELSWYWWSISISNKKRI
jgi:hypothetical protein